MLLRRDAAVAANITVTNRDKTDKDARTQLARITEVSGVFNEPMQSANLQRVMTRADHNADSDGDDRSQYANGNEDDSDGDASRSDDTDRDSDEKGTYERETKIDGQQTESEVTQEQADINVDDIETDKQPTEKRGVVTLRRTLQDQKGQVTDTGQVDSGKRRRAVAISPYDGRKRKHM